MNDTLTAPEATTQNMNEYRFEFRGTTGEYFKIWLSNVLLTIVTLGIFSAWAKVRSRRYFYGNTFLDGVNFEYHARPLSILFARLAIFGIIIGGAIWAGADVIRTASYSLLVSLILPWALVRGWSFNARYSSYRGVRFSFRKNYFRIYLIYMPVFVVVSVFTNFSDIFPNIDKSTIHQIVLISLSLGLLLSLLLPWALVRGWSFNAGSSSGWNIRFSFREIYFKIYLIYMPLLLLITIPVYINLNIDLNKNDFVYLAYQVIPILIVVGFTVPFMMCTYHHFKASFHSWGKMTFRFDVKVRDYMLAIYGSILLFSLLGLIVGASIQEAFHELFAALIFFLFYFYVTSYFFKLFWTNVHAAKRGNIQCNIPVFAFAFKIRLVNIILILLSLGFLYPWAQIRKLRFIASHMKVIAPSGTLDSVTADSHRKESALGDEAGVLNEGLDFDVGII